MQTIAARRSDRMFTPHFGAMLNAAAAESDPEDRLDAYRLLSERFPIAIVWWSLAVELGRRARALRSVGSAFAAELHAEALDALAETTRLDRRMGLELIQVLRDLGLDCRGAFHA